MDNIQKERPWRITAGNDHISCIQKLGYTLNRYDLVSTEPVFMDLIHPFEYIILNSIQHIGILNGFQGDNQAAII